MDIEQESTEQSEPQQQPAKKRKGSTLLIRVIIWIVVIVVAVIIVLLLLRSCQPTPVKTTDASLPSTAASTDLQLANRVHAAIHPLMVGGKTQEDDAVYIIDIGHAKGKVIAIIRLVGNAADVAKLVGPTGAAGIAADFERETLAKVPEITDVRVVDFDGALVSAQSR